MSWGGETDRKEEEEEEEEETFYMRPPHSMKAISKETERERGEKKEEGKNVKWNPWRERNGLNKSEIPKKATSKYFNIVKKEVGKKMCSKTKRKKRY